MGDTKVGPFDIPADVAVEWLRLSNPNKKSNDRVVRPWVNSLDITRRPRNLWIVDFPPGMSQQDASQFEMPFEHIRKHVRDFRAQARSGDRTGVKWWIHQRPRPDMRAAIERLPRFIGTPTIAKHRLFVWLTAPTLPDHQLIVFARDDDYFFGVLHSAVHERWSRRMGTQLREAESGCRYTPTTCFETFPFPPLAGGIGKDPPRSPLGKGRGSGRAQRRAAVPHKKSVEQPPSAVGLGVEQPPSAVRDRIAAAAKKLHELREEWLNPTFRGKVPMLTADQLKKRTLTNLYNERPTWLELAHLELDRAVLAAYGWPEEWAEALQPKRDARGKVNPILGVADPAVEQELLSRLLGLNLETATGQAPA